MNWMAWVTIAVNQIVRRLESRFMRKNIFLAVVLSSLIFPVLADEIWVSNEKSDTVVVIDIETLEVSSLVDIIFS